MCEWQSTKTTLLIKVLTMIEVAGAAEAFKANVFVVWANTDMMFLC